MVLRRLALTGGSGRFSGHQPGVAAAVAQTSALSAAWSVAPGAGGRRRSCRVAVWRMPSGVPLEAGECRAFGWEAVVGIVVAAVLFRRAGRLAGATWSRKREVV